MPISESLYRSADAIYQAKETFGTLERNALEKLAEPDDGRKKGMDARGMRCGPFLFRP